jgi:glycosyltransferase involved in cell wall biosynthesis
MASHSSDQNVNLSVVIIVKNAASSLSKCLASLPPACEILVLDCGSTDKTVEIAKSFGAIVSVRPFTNFSDQKNAAIDLCTRDWVFSIDADEEMDATLRQSLVSACRQNSNEPELYTVSRQLVFMGRKMRYGRTRDEPKRFFRRNTARFVGSIHEQLQPNDPSTKLLQLSGTLWHHSYQNLDEYFEKFNRYTTLMAKDRCDRAVVMPNVLSLALRPFANFFYRYVFCGGFMDGYPGFTWALLGAFYSFVKYAKYRELVINQQLGGTTR